MKKLVALAIASSFAFGAASTFAAPVVVKEQVRVEHRVGRAPVTIKKVHYVKKVHRHHFKRHHQHRQF